jgi:hypothetical protein
MDNIAAAEELLAFLDPEKLKFEGREEDVPEELRQKVHFVQDLDLAIKHYNSNHGIDIFVDIIEHLDSKASSAVDKDKKLKEKRDEIQKQLFSFPWGQLPIDDDTDAMLNIGDNTEFILASVMNHRLVFGKSGDCLERCVQLLELGFLPFGYDEENEFLFAYSRPVS